MAGKPVSRILRTVAETKGLRKTKDLHRQLCQRCHPWSDNGARHGHSRLFGDAVSARTAAMSSVRRGIPDRHAREISRALQNSHSGQYKAPLPQNFRFEAALKQSGSTTSRGVAGPILRFRSSSTIASGTDLNLQTVKLARRQLVETRWLVKVGQERLGVRLSVPVFRCAIPQRPGPRWVENPPSVKPTLGGNSTPARWVENPPTGVDSGI